MLALWLSAACAIAQAPTNPAPSAPKAVAVLQTNWEGGVEWVIRTNHVARANTEFLTPQQTARVFVSLLDAHMVAVQYQWVTPPESRARYHELVERLIQTTLYAPMSDQERHAAELRERELLEAIRIRDVEIAGLKAARVRLTNEVARLKRELERREK